MAFMKVLQNTICKQLSSFLSVCIVQRIQIYYHRDYLEGGLFLKGKQSFKVCTTLLGTFLDTRVTLYKEPIIFTIHNTFALNHMYYHYQARNKDAPLEPPRRHCWVQIVCNSVSQCQMKDATMVDDPGSWLTTSCKILSHEEKPETI